MFEPDISGTLMEMKKSNQTKLGFMVWFPFVRSHMGRIREGSLVAVRNFSSDHDTDHYSIMRITSVMPKHYAMMASRDGYPGFVEEAALSASKDWEQDRPIEDTTKIECDAIPSSFEIRKPRLADGSESQIVPESNIPMPGEKAKILDEEWTKRIINHDLQRRPTDVITMGTLVNSKNVDILVLWDSMIRTHFGVFAYTNAGKSNFLSTFMSLVFAKASDSVKMVVYDLMGEYGVLLIDILYNSDNACIVCLSPNAVPKSVSNFWRNPNDENLDTAAKDVVNTTVLPKKLAADKSRLIYPMRMILKDGKIKILKPSSDLTLYNIVKSTLTVTKPSDATRQFIDHVKSHATGPATVTSIDNLIKGIDGYTMSGSSTVKAEDLRRAVRGVLSKHMHTLQETAGIDDRFQITVEQMVSDLNKPDFGVLYVIQDGDDSQVRSFSYRLGEMALGSRRSHGIISPSVSFIYDEADQFIAQDDKPPYMRESKQVAAQLARRGRKYGLGIGIATQRIVYLDTNILGQPHTYFVSKLPRASDREKIQEAFGLSDETLAESLRFGVGQWLLISHSATGIDGLPIPIQLHDANERIMKFLNSNFTGRGGSSS